jgi:uncharacterized protein YbjT (DUF2867 family)
MSQAPILITGGTGRQGGTGRGAIRELVALGYRVRAMVRCLDERSESLEALGSEVAVGDYANFESLNHALAGVEAAYFVYPVATGSRLLGRSSIKVRKRSRAWRNSWIPVRRYVSSIKRQTYLIVSNFYPAPRFARCYTTGGTIPFREAILSYESFSA